MIICSLNVRGLSNEKKRRETFLWLKKKEILYLLLTGSKQHKIIWIGTFRLQRRTIETNKNITWSFHKVKALDVWFSTIKEESATLNFQEKKEKFLKIIENWQFRRLALLGKITVIKSLLASQLVYILSPLPTPSGYLINFYGMAKVTKLKEQK